LACLSDAEAEWAHVVGHDWGAALGWVFASPVPVPIVLADVLLAGPPRAP
jgi:pimeloyl-ACP methyl ester carboxylesterase